MNPPAGRLVELLGRTTHVLLDFDGPVCRLFAGYPAPQVAARVRELLASYGVALSAAPAGDDGPIQVLSRVADLNDPTLTRRVADQIRDVEVTAAATATPTPGAVEVLHAARGSGRPVAVVSNNSTEAVRTYLDRHHLSGYVDLVVARHDGLEPRLLKPDAHLVGQALTNLTATPTEAVFVGDSLGDIHAGRAAKVPVIGYANKPGKRQAMIDAGAAIVIDTMTDLADALHATRVPS